MPPEERQHVVPAPAGKPKLTPVIVVGGLPAHIDHGVDGGGAADHLAAGIVEAAAVEPFLRLGLEHPVRARIADREEIADRDVEPDPVVHAAGLEQQHAHSGVGGETVRQHATSRSRSDDDIVVFAFDRRCGGHAISSLFDRRPCGALGMPPSPHETTWKGQRAECRSAHSDPSLTPVGQALPGSSPRTPATRQHGRRRAKPLRLEF